MEFGVRHASEGDFKPLPPFAGPQSPAGNRAQVGIGSANLTPVRVECSLCARFIRGVRTSARISHGICPACLESAYPDLVATVRASCPHETFETVGIKPLYQDLAFEIRTVRCETCGHTWELEPVHADKDGGR